MSKAKTREDRATYESTYNGKRILTNKNKGLGCDTDILDKLDRLITFYTERHNKVGITRFDTRFLQNQFAPDDNKAFSRFIAPFTKALKRKGLDPKYIAVREQSREKHQHYHVAVLTDGNKIQHPHVIIKAAEEHWNRTIGQDKDYKGLVDYCTKSRSGDKQTNHYRLRRGDENYDEELNNCFERCSYLAKINTKGKAPHRTREVFSSKIPKK